MAEIARIVVDIETTGLDKWKDVPLEIGIAAIDLYGDEVIAGESWLIEDSTSEYKEAIARGKAHPIVGPMHTKSGLWKDLDNVEESDWRGRQPHQVDNLVLDWFDEHGIPHGEFPMMGSSVDFDRGFMKIWLPKAEAHFHYRVIDMSTLKELCRSLNPPVFEGLEEKREIHRSYPDLLDTIRDYKFYVENFLFCE